MIETELIVGNDDWTVAGDFLADKLQLSRSKIRDLMNKGGVWQQQRAGKQRLRRVSSVLKTGDVLHVNYDAARLAKPVKDIDLIADFDLYSVWRKPAMMPLYGDQWADFDSFARNVELACRGEREMIIFENLSEIESGAMLIAHSRRAAWQLAEKMASGQLGWQLRGELKGKIEHGALAHGAINATLRTLAYDDERNCSKVVLTCRAQMPAEKAQFAPVIYWLREALAAKQHPVVGDPEFNDDDRAQLKLRVVELLID